MKNNIEIEREIYLNTDLLEIAKDYCEFNIAKDDSLGTLLSLLEIMLHNQKKIIHKLDTTKLKEAW